MIKDQRQTAYWVEVQSVLGRLLSMLDRERASESCGNCDREFWSWKFRDSPVTMLQAAVYPLAVLWSKPLPGNLLYQNGRVFEWIVATLTHIRSMQRHNGSFDLWGPHTDHGGVTLAMAQAIMQCLEALADSVDVSRCASLRETVRRAAEFAYRNEEDYAFISNHQAQYAVAFRIAQEFTGDARYGKRSEEIIGRILGEQSGDGWYREYQGPDPGYESLGISHLADYWRRTGSARVLESLRRSVAFYAHCVHPDGSVGGVYGSRHTQLYYPAGLEILSSHIPMARTIARCMRERLALRNVVTLANVDTGNLVPLVSNYLQASLLSSDESGVSSLRLPCETLEGARHFSEAGISVAGNRHLYAVVNASKGGVCRVFDKHTRKIAYEDAGYLVRAGGHQWTSQMIGLGQITNSPGASQIACATSLSKVRQELPTPVKVLCLRVLNLTVCRSLVLGSWLRRLIVRRLLTAQSRGPLRLYRSVTIGAEDVHFEDRLELSGHLRVEEVALPRSFMAIHMGSAKYFHPSELEPIPQVAVNGMAGELNRGGVAKIEFTLRFSPTGGPQLRVGGATLRTESQQVEAVARP